MRLDEMRHAQEAISRGATKLPLPIATAMRFTAKVMTGSAYWV